MLNLNPVNLGNGILFYFQAAKTENSKEAEKLYKKKGTLNESKDANDKNHQKYGSKSQKAGKSN